MTNDTIGEGKVALVTGAGRGLGRGFAERVAGMGYAVGIHGLTDNEPAEYGEGTTVTNLAAGIAERFEVETRAVLGDLSITSNVARVVDEVEQSLGEIDLLVQNAGGDIAAVGGKPEPNDAIFINEADVRSVLDRNLMTTIFVCQEVARRMIERRRGRIVTVSSQGAFAASPAPAIYITAKMGVIAYTRCLATQLREFEINVNCIAPGDVRSGRFLGTREVDPSRLATEGTLDRIATLDEIARVVEFFAGPQGDFVSGQVLMVNGGNLP
ncbi:MAG: 3-oxoacyl-ACP reductase [Planctomycetaceae bacterium]|nr:3-oxoacyl-ACP reductase [Planctomycetaceae bacterium]